MLALSLALVSTAAAPYPTQETLKAFGEVCFDPSLESQDHGLSKSWKDLATQKGWKEIEHSPAAPAYDPKTYGYTAQIPYIMYHSVKALNYQLLMPLIAYENAQVTDELLFSKQLNGRELYLSLLGIVSDNPSLAECRIHDRRALSLRKNPIENKEINLWLGKNVKASQGFYRGTLYTWPVGNRYNSVEIHFNTSAKEMGKITKNYDPYASVGMTIVRRDYVSLIVT
jgi:hypothetical protein